MNVGPIINHSAVLAPDALALDAARRPASGGISLFPEPEKLFVDAVTQAGGALIPLSSDTRGLICLSPQASPELRDALRDNPQIGWVQLPWAGVDAFAEELMASSGTDRLWTSAKGAYAQPVAEHALALALALLRELPTRIRARSWGAPRGISLYGLNVVIIGAGGIAIELIRLLKPFGVSVTVVRRKATAVAGAIATVTTERLGDVLPGADVVVIAAALTGSTKHLFGAPEFAMMKKTAVLVNIARGGLVDTDALVTALDAEEILGAALDVTDPEPLVDGHPLWQSERVIITPHTADTPEMVAPLLAERVRINVAAFLGDGEFIGIVDHAAGY